MAQAGNGFVAKLRARSLGHYGSLILLPAFVLAKVVEIAVLITVIGMTSNWVGYFGSRNIHIPGTLLVVLVFSAIGILQCGASIFASLEGQDLLLCAFGILDVMYIIVFAIFAVKFDYLTFINCFDVGNESTAERATHAQTFVDAINSTSLGAEQSWSWNAELSEWVESSQQQCFELRAVWGLFITLALLFFVSLSLVLAMVHCRRKLEKATAKGAKGSEGQ